jgi:hypothetical protein
VRRQGNDAERIINHIFIAKGTIDETILKIVREKGTTQTGLLQRLGAAITEESSMEKLGTQSGERVWPAGWGPPPTSANPGPAGVMIGPDTTGGTTPQQQGTAEMLREAVALRCTRADEAAQKAAIKAKIDGSQPPPDRTATAKSLFSPEVQAAMEGGGVAQESPLIAPAQTPTTIPVDYDRLADAIVRNVAKRLLALTT